MRALNRKSEHEARNTDLTAADRGAAHPHSDLFLPTPRGGVPPLTRRETEPGPVDSGQAHDAPMEPVETPYADKTFGDKNPLKRAFQRQRLRDALQLARRVPEPSVILDFGAGNGELCRWLSRAYPRARLVCYEPHPGLLEQARANAGDGVTYLSQPDQLDGLRADLVFCLEVFEHLPPTELQAAIAQIRGALAPRGRVVAGVPVETGLPALYKGVFRMTRRWGVFDARPMAVLAAAFHRPPTPRPEVELYPGARYHLHHLGFDHRRLERFLECDFIVEARVAGPLPWVGGWLNSEVSWLLRPRSGPGGEQRRGP